MISHKTDGTKKANPASGFLIMAAFNLVAAIGVTVFYLLYRGAEGEESWLLLVAALVLVAASIGSIVLYNVFKRKLSGSTQP